jgi:putative oxidoreductase
MKITAVIARFFLGLIFLVFGLNGFLHFIPASPPSGIAGQFVGALFVSLYLVLMLQIISAVLPLANHSR